MSNKCQHYDAERFDLGPITDRVFECVHCKRQVSRKLGKKKTKR